MSKNTGPIRLVTVGDVYTESARIGKILWVGTTEAAQVAEVRDPVTDSIFWSGQAAGTDTYISESFGERGLHAPNGFKLYALSAGVVYVYLNEN